MPVIRLAQVLRTGCQSHWSSGPDPAIVTTGKVTAGILVANMSDDEKKKARNDAKVARLMRDEDSRPELKLVKTGGSSTPQQGLRIKDLIDTVAATTGGKKPEVRQIVEATLEAIGKALATGKDLNVPPLGKLRMAKNNGTVLTLKLRLADGPKAAGLALADEDEDS